MKHLVVLLALLAPPSPVAALHDLGSFWAIYNATTDPADIDCIVAEGAPVSEDCCFQAGELLPHAALQGNDTCFELGPGLIPFSGCVGEGVAGYGEDCVTDKAPFVAKDAKECGCSFVIEGSGCYKANDLPEQQWFVYLDGDSCHSLVNGTIMHEEMPDMEVPPEEVPDEGMEDEEETPPLEVPDEEDDMDEDEESAPPEVLEEDDDMDGGMEDEEETTPLEVPDEEDDMAETDPEMEEAPPPAWEYVTLDAAFGGCIGAQKDEDTDTAISRQGETTDELLLKECRSDDDSLQWRWDDAGRFRSKLDDSLCMQVGNSLVIEQGVEALTNRTSLFLKDCADGTKREFQVFDEFFAGPLFLASRPDLCVVHDGARPVIGEAKIMLLGCDLLGGDRALGWEANDPCTHEPYCAIYF